MSTLVYSVIYLLDKIMAGIYDDPEELKRVLFESLVEFSEHLRTAGDALLTEEERLEKYRKQYEEKQKKNAAAVDAMTDSFLGFAKQISDGQAASAMNGALLGISKKLAEKGPLGQALLAFTKMFIHASEEFNKLFDVFKSISEVGVVASITDVRNSMESLGLSMQLTQQILTKNSESLSKFGGSAHNGRIMFENLASQVKDIREDFLRLGVQATEFGDYQAQYMETLQINGQLEKVSEQQFRNGLTAYVNELSILSTLTGKSRKILADEMKARETDLQFRLIAQGMSVDQQKELQSSLELIKHKFGAGMEQAIKAGILGKMNDKELQGMLVNIGDDFFDIAQRIKGGGDDAVAAMNELARRTGQAATSYDPKVVALLKDSSIIFSGIATGYKVQHMAELKNRSDLIEEFNKLRAGSDSATKSMADKENAELKAAQQIQSLTTSFTSVTKVMHMFAEAVSLATTALNKMFGWSIFGKGASGASAPTVGTPGTSTAAAAGGAAATAGGAAATAGGAAATAGGAAAPSPKRVILPTAPAVSSSNQPATPVSANSLNTQELERLLVFGSRSGSLENFKLMNPEVQSAFLAMAQDYNRMTGGKKLNINSSFRDSSKQKQLYDEWIAGGKKGNPVARPGTSFHELGRAIDIQPDQVNALNSMGLLQNYGFKTLRNDPPHIYMRDGGIASGSVSGYDATLHGTELVQPLDQNSILQKLATTPSNVAQSESNSNNRRLIEETHAMTRKYDEMIKVLGDIRNIQRTLMMRTYA